MINKANIFVCDICGDYIEKDIMDFKSFYHDVMTHLQACQESNLQPLSYWIKYPISKGDLAKKYYANITFDYALPETWINDMVDKLQLEYHDITCQFVWGYPDNYSFGCPLPLTTDAKVLIQRYNDRISANYPVEF